MRFLTLLAAGASLVAAGYDAPIPGQDPPIVDIGYAVHQGLYKEATGAYHFNNIQYGNVTKRFSEATNVTKVDRDVNDGSDARKCPQGYPEWSLAAEAAATNKSTADLLNRILEDPEINENCLFLDVVVPEKLCGSNVDGCYQSKKAPVMVWISGGGFVFGDKSQPNYDFAGLINQSMADGSDGTIYVAINYRLGMFGWLDALGDDAVTPNCGLLDQRLALQWVQDNIHLFGGDGDRVTVFGESAGGASIMHQLTAGGGTQKSPFKQAIIQSPGMSVTYNPEGMWNATLAMASKVAGKSITSADDLVALDSKTMIKINAETIFYSLPGSFGFGPVVDDTFVPDRVSKLLADGRLDTEPGLMVGHNANESSLFVPSFIDTYDKILQALQAVTLIGVSNETLEHILTELYPDPSQTDLYDTQHDRYALLVNEVNFICNTRYLSKAFGGNNYNYRFEVPPATHGQDLAYTFYHDGSTFNVIPDLAVAMQMYFTSFAANGTPACGHGVPEWLRYGEHTYTQAFGVSGVSQDVDETANQRCDYWQGGSFLVQQ